ncbi:MAG: Kynurenine 3-monooxygenase [Chlorobi bacterium OLB5]|nr:MAG: Kynurenine 3-monooxygenase [Chlorobi bacterium OLB5]
MEAILYAKYPDRFIPKYSMVTFLRVPYSTALRRGNIQENILLMLSEGIKSPEEVDMKLAAKFIDEKLEPMKKLS